jgi:hypothetical protein
MKLTPWEKHKEKNNKDLYRDTNCANLRKITWNYFDKAYEGDLLQTSNNDVLDKLEKEFRHKVNIS